MPSPFPTFFQLTAGTTLGLAFRYAILAGIAWLLCYVFFKKRWAHRKIIPRDPEALDIRREIAYSISSVVIFGLMGALTILTSRAGLTQIYWRIGDYGWLWFWASIVCTILLHDTYFYWTHRAMHHPKLFRLFHRVHHLSMNPSPWSSYAFSPLEAVVQAGIFPLTAMIIPIHPFAFLIFMFWQIVHNILGHTGFEIHHRGLMNSFLRCILNTPTNHIMHHEKIRGNYGIYFNFWDRLMGTNHPEYETRFREVTSRPSAPGSSVSSVPGAAPSHAN